MSDYSIPNGDLKEVAEAFERITRGVQGSHPGSSEQPRPRRD